jgi:hypothetical protein
MTRRATLNWAIFGYIALYLFCYSKIVSAYPSSVILFAFAPIALLFWQAIILSNSFRFLSKNDFYSFYERLDSGDYWRVFFILLFGSRPLASDYLLGFFVYSAITIALFTVLVFISCVEYYSKKKYNTLERWVSDFQLFSDILGKEFIYKTLWCSHNRPLFRKT